jgi:uncharacterized protein YyaL (SSP411 family)
MGAQEFGEKAGTVEHLLDEARQRLFAAREQRIKPFRDEKVIVAWNGLMISAFFDAANLLGDDRVKQDAVRSIEFMLTHLVRDGRLLHSFKDGQAKLAGYLDDHACFVAACLTPSSRPANNASNTGRGVQSRHAGQFWDEVRGGFSYGPDHESLIHRPKDLSIMPSPAGILATSPLRLYYYTGEEELFQKAEQTLRLFRDRWKMNLSVSARCFAP